MMKRLLVCFILFLSINFLACANHILGFGGGSVLPFMQQSSDFIWLYRNNLMSTAYYYRYSYHDTWGGSWIKGRTYCAYIPTRPIVIFQPINIYQHCLPVYSDTYRAYDFSFLDKTINNSGWWLFNTTNFPQAWTSMSVSAWVYLVKLPTNNQAIFCVSDASVGTLWTGIRNNGKLIQQFTELYRPNTRIVYGGITVTTGQWHHLFFTQTKPDILHMYIDGVYDVTSRVGSANHTDISNDGRFNLLGALYTNLRFRNLARNVVVWANTHFSSNNVDIAAILNQGPYANIRSYPRFDKVAIYALCDHREYYPIDDSISKSCSPSIWTNLGNTVPYSAVSLSSSKLNWRSYIAAYTQGATVGFPTYKVPNIETNTKFACQAWFYYTGLEYKPYILVWSGNAKGFIFDLPGGNEPRLLVASDWYASKGFDKRISAANANLYVGKWYHFFAYYNGQNKTNSIKLWLDGKPMPVSSPGINSPCTGSIISTNILVYRLYRGTISHITDMYAIWTNQVWTDTDVWKQFWAKEQAAAHGWSPWVRQYRDTTWLTNSMVLYLPFSFSYSSYNTWYFSNHGSAAGSGHTFIYTDDNYALSLSGAGYVSVPHHTSLNLSVGNWTYAQWIQFRSTNMLAKALFSKRDTGGAGIEVILNHPSSGVHTIYMRDKTTTNTLSGTFTTNLSHSTWYSIIVGRNSSTSVFANVNGNSLPISYSTQYPVDIDCSASLFIGASASGGNLPVAYIDEAILVKFAMDSSQMTSYYSLSRAGTE